MCLDRSVVRRIVLCPGKQHRQLSVSPDADIPQHSVMRHRAFPGNGSRLGIILLSWYSRLTDLIHKGLSLSPLQPVRFLVSLKPANNACHRGATIRSAFIKTAFAAVEPQRWQPTSQITVKCWKKRKTNSKNPFHLRWEILKLPVLLRTLWKNCRIIMDWKEKSLKDKNWGRKTTSRTPKTRLSEIRERLLNLTVEETTQK